MDPRSGGSNPDDQAPRNPGRASRRRNFPPDVLQEKPPTNTPSATGAPWWFWPLGYLAIFGADAALVLALVAQRQNLAVAAGVPTTLTIISLSVLRGLADHMNRRD
jgi:hypothetical protein